MNRMKQLLTNKRFLYGSGSVALIAAFIAIMLVLNLIAGLLVDKFSWKIDLTEQQIFALSDQAREAVKQIDKPIQITYFTNDAASVTLPEEIIQQMISVNGNLSLQKLDPAQNPGAVQKYTTMNQQINYYDLVFECGDQFKIVTANDMIAMNSITQQSDLLVAEQKYVSAMNAVTRDKAAVVAVTQGHGELDIADVEQLLSDENITVELVNTLTEELPNSCDLLLVPAPQTDFTPEEIEKIDAFLNKGKGMQVYFDFDTMSLPKLEEYMSEWGVAVGKDYVIETDSQQVYGMYPSNIIPTLQAHEITNSLIDNKIQIVIPWSKSITPLWQSSNGVNVTTLAQSSEQSFATEDMTVATLEKGENDKGGPIGLMTVSTKSVGNGAKANVLACGSSDVLSSQVLQLNRDLFVNSVVWMTTGSEMVSISPKSLVGSTLQMSQFAILAWTIFVVVIIPIVVLVIGLTVWLRRRHL